MLNIQYSQNSLTRFQSYLPFRAGLCSWQVYQSWTRNSFLFAFTLIINCLKRFLLNCIPDTNKLTGLYNITLMKSKLFSLVYIFWILWWEMKAKIFLKQPIGFTMDQIRFIKLYYKAPLMHFYSNISESLIFAHFSLRKFSIVFFII